MKTLKTAFTFAMVALIAQNSYADQITSILHTKGSDPSLHTQSSRPVIKSTLKDGRYYFETCKEHLQFDNKNLTATSSISSCKTIGVKEGYSILQIEKRIQEVDLKVKNARLYDAATIAVGVIAGAGIGTLPALKSSQKFVDDFDGIARNAREASSYIFLKTKTAKKNPKLLEDIADSASDQLRRTGDSIEYFYNSFAYNAKLGAAVGGLSGGVIGAYLVWGVDEETVLMALKEATGDSDINTVSVELDGVDIVEISRELNILLAGIY